MNEIRVLLGLCESHDPTDKDRVHLKKLVRELKSKNDSMQKDMKHMEQVIEQLKGGKYNELEAGKMISDDEIKRLRKNLEDNDRQITELQKEN